MIIVGYIACKHKHPLEFRTIKVRDSGETYYNWYKGTIHSDTKYVPKAAVIVGLAVCGTTLVGWVSEIYACLASDDEDLQPRD